MKALQLIHHMPYDVLKQKYKKEKDARLKSKLLAILYLYENKPLVETAYLIHFSVVSLRLWVHRWNDHGVEGLKRKTNSGRKAALSGETWAHIKDDVLISPRSFGYEFGLWRLKEIAGHIEKHYGTEFSLCWVWRMLKKVNMTLLVPRPKPIKADKEKQAHFEQRLTELVRHRKDNERILFQDESSFSFSPEPHRMWAVKGSRPILPIHGGRKRQNVIGAIDPVSDQGFFQRIENLNAKTFLQFLRGILAQYPSHFKIYMVVDNAKPHHANLLQLFLEQNRERIELIYLPPYSPDLNPIEGIWQDVKKDAVHNQFSPTYDEFQEKLTVSLKKMSRSEGKIKQRCNLEKYFHPPIEMSVK
jgi:transposase